MEKEKFIKSTIILVIGGLITKVLGMIIKIINNRLIGIEAIGIYMLIYPTFSLFMALSQFSLPTSISKLVSEERFNNKRLLFNTFPILLIFNVSLIIIILLSSKFIANSLLNDPRCYLPLLCISMVLPFEALSNLLRGYFFGKQRMLPHVISHVIEQIVRLSLTIIIVPSLVSKNIIYAVCFLVIVNMISELTSIIILLLFMPKIKIKKDDFRIDKRNIKNILEISVPNTSTKIIGNIGYFLEPVLLSLALIKSGYTSEYITLQYGIITGYSMPILLLPGFFTGAISNSILPVISKAYTNKNYSYIKRKIKQALLICLSIGIPFTIIIMLFPDIFLKLLYNTEYGINYLKLLAIPFLFYYIEIPLSSCLLAMNKSKQVMIDNIIGITIKTLSIYFLSLTKLGINSFIVASSLNIIIVTILHITHIKNVLKN